LNEASSLDKIKEKGVNIIAFAIFEEKQIRQLHKLLDLLFHNYFHGF